MNRYFFTALTLDGENANAFIDAPEIQAAVDLYSIWAIEVVGEVPKSYRIWRLPSEATVPKALNWSADLIEVTTPSGFDQ